ncbi:MAG: hypothetical protein TUN42_01800 [Dehalogenimonas sp.]
MGRTSGKAIDKYLGFEPGTFDHIPHYARGEAMDAMRQVMKVERSKLFRPGLYYIVLSDLSRSTETSSILGTTLNRKRVESFILRCVECLRYIEPENYFWFVREIGDAVLLLFSSFKDAYTWWWHTESWLDTQNGLWSTELSGEKSSLKQLETFSIEAKTVIHAGEVAYSDNNIPLALAVNQTFKIEKLFGPHELGVTHMVKTAAEPVMTSLGLNPIRKNRSIILPGSTERTPLYLCAKWGELTERDRLWPPPYES